MNFQMANSKNVIKDEQHTSQQVYESIILKYSKTLKNSSKILFVDKEMF